jgi:large repetitive protein
MSKSITTSSHHLTKIMLSALAALALLASLGLLLARPAYAQGPVVNIGDLPPGKVVTITFRAAITNPLPAGVAQVCNQGQVSGGNFATFNTNDPTTGASGDPTCTTVPAAPDLVIAKSDGGATATPGDIINYSLTYSNTGNQNATGVVLTETVPANTTFTGSGWTCAPTNNAGSTCTRSVGALAAGDSGSATFAVTVIDPVPAGVSQISNTASIGDGGVNGADTTPANNSDTDTTPLTAAPDLQLTKSDGGVTATPGGTVAYTLNYSNSGNQGATGVVLTETVPTNTTFNAGASTAGWGCLPDNTAGSTCTLTVGALAGGGSSNSATFAVTVINPVPAGVTQISNAASIGDDGANGADPTSANNSDNDTTPLTAEPDMRLTKSDGGITATPGGTITYTLSFSNAGNQGSTGVTLTETVPANTTFTGADWSCLPNNNAGSICTRGGPGISGGGGGSASTPFVVTVDSPLPAGVTQIQWR